MSYIEAFLQAVLQGLTEFLPVSSSGHLSLFQHFTGQSGESGVFFSLMLHLGTLIAVFIAFRHTIWQLILELFSMIWDLLRGKFKWKERGPYRNVLVMLIVACIPMIFVLVFKDFYTGIAADNDIVVEGVCFLITAALLFIADRCVKGHKGPGDIKPRDGLIVGLLQVTPADLSIGIFPILIGVVVSAVVGFLAIKLVNWLIKSDKFRIFMIYTAILGVLVVGIGIFEHVVGMNIVQYFAK